MSEEAANIEVSKLSKSRSRSKGTSSNNKVVPSLKSMKSVKDSNTNIGKSQISPNSQTNATARSGVNPVVLAFRIDKLEAEMKKLADYEYQVEDLQK